MIAKRLLTPYCFLFFLLLTPVSVFGQLSDIEIETYVVPQTISPVGPDVLSVKSIYQLFDIISSAYRNHTFESHLTYEANGHISTLKFEHELNEENVSQNLIFMNGLSRRVVRQQSLSFCDEGGTRWGIWPSIAQAEHVGALFNAYSFKPVGTERVADRLTYVYDILPKDEFRYGYRYSIDKETGLVLKFVTLKNNRVIERLQTVSFQLNDSRVQSPSEAVEQNYAFRVPEFDPCYRDQFNTEWQATWLPEGFVSVGNRVTPQGEQMLTFADGLVTVSVFIADSRLNGLSKVTARHGAMVVVVSPIKTSGNYHAAVVGEIPSDTARKIANSISKIKTAP